MSECGVGINFKHLSSKETSLSVRDKFGYRLQVTEEVEEKQWETIGVVKVAVSFRNLNVEASETVREKLYEKISECCQSL